MMLMSDAMRELETFRGTGDESALLRCDELAGKAASTTVLGWEPVELGNPFVAYGRLSFGDPAAAPLYARTVQPLSPGPHPVLLYFHDAQRPVRGYHHMTRFAALGFSVVALEDRLVGEAALAAACDAGGEALSGLVLDALRARLACERWDGVDAGPVVAWGEGLGGTLALAVAALMEDPMLAGVAALNPYGEALVHCASRITAPVLLGTCMMDELAAPLMQAAVLNNVAGEHRRLVYPKYGHERVNDFEDELLIWLRRFVPHAV